MLRKLVQLTDTHLFADPERSHKGVNTHDSLKGVVADVAARHPDLDVLLLTGDLSQDEAPESYAALWRLLAPLRSAPVHALPGNHDDLDAMRATLPDDGIRILTDIRLGPWRVALLNSQVPGQVHGELGAAQIDRLHASLQASSEHTLVAVHHPPVKVGSAWIDASRCIDGEALLEVATAPPVSAVACGHVHQVFESKHNGVAILTTPSTCFQFQPAVDTFVLDPASGPGYRVFTLEDDGRWSSGVERVKEQ